MSDESFHELVLTVETSVPVETAVESLHDLLLLAQERLNAYSLSLE